MNQAVKRRRWFVWPLCAVLAGLCASAGAAAGSRAELAAAIRDRLAALQQLQRAAAAEREVHEREREPVQRQIERLERDVQRVRGEVQTLRADVECKRARLGEREQTADRAAAQVGAAAGRAADLAEALHRRSRRGIPSVQQLSGRLEDLAEPLPGDGAADRAEAVVALHEFVGDYLQSHRDRSIGNREVGMSEPGVARHAYVVRLGSVAELYLTEDGRTAGLAARQEGERWRSPLDAGRHERVSRVVAVLRDRAAPRLIETPVALPAAEGAE